MKNQRLLIALTVLNLGLLAYQTVRPKLGSVGIPKFKADSYEKSAAKTRRSRVFRQSLAIAQENAPPQVLRARGLEIVDERGKVRAQLSVFPENPKHKLANGDPYPETVLLRLIDPNGRPSVKLSVDVRGGGLYLGGAEDPTMARLSGDGAEAKLQLVNKDKQERVLKPWAFGSSCLPKRDPRRAQPTPAA